MAPKWVKRGGRGGVAAFTGLDRVRRGCSCGARLFTPQCAFCGKVWPDFEQCDIAVSSTSAHETVAPPDPMKAAKPKYAVTAVPSYDPASPTPWESLAAAQPKYGTIAPPSSQLAISLRSTPILHPHRSQPPPRKSKLREPSTAAFPKVSFPRRDYGMRSEFGVKSFKLVSDCYIESAGTTVTCDTCAETVAYLKENGEHIGAPGQSYYAQPEYICRGCLARVAAQRRFGKSSSLTVDEWAELASDVWGNMDPPPADWVRCWSLKLKRVYFASLTSSETRFTLGDPR